MRYRSSVPRTITAKFNGQCRCCGAAIKAGETVDYYPSLKAIAHVGGLDGNSARCSANIAAKMYPDPGELNADRWNETHY
jgi:hypothetical protein